MSTKYLSNIDVGGMCKKIELIDNNNDMVKLIKELHNKNEKYKVIGSGSNIYFNNNYDGVIVKNNCQKIIKTKYLPIQSLNF